MGTVLSTVFSEDTSGNSTNDRGAADGGGSGMAKLAAHDSGAVAEGWQRLRQQGGSSRVEEAGGVRSGLGSAVGGQQTIIIGFNYTKELNISICYYRPPPIILYLNKGYILVKIRTEKYRRKLQRKL